MSHDPNEYNDWEGQEPSSPAEEMRHTLHDVIQRLVDKIEHLEEENVELQRVVKVRTIELALSKARYDHALKILARIYGCLYPPPVTTADGKTYRFGPPDPNSYMQALSDAIRAIPEELAKEEKQ